MKQNIDLNNLKLQYDEVAVAKWAHDAEIRRMVQTGEFIGCHYMDRLFNMVNSNIQLRRATVADAEELFAMQKEVFMPSYIKYQDHETSPVMQTRERFLKRFDTGDYYKILYNGSLAGSVFIYEKEPEIVKFHIINIREAYQNKGISQEVMTQLELMYPQAENWEFETILS